MNGDPMLCAPCRVGDHRSHTDDGCPDDNNFNSECQCPVDLVWPPRTPLDIDASLEKCLEAIRKRRAEVDRTALQNMGSPDKDRPTWMDIDHLLEIIDRSHAADDDLADRILQILGNPGITETTYAKLKVVLAGKAYTAPLDDYVTLLERSNGRLREVLKEALEQTGCDGDLCNYRWHEKARVLLGE